MNSTYRGANVGAELLAKLGLYAREVVILLWPTRRPASWKGPNIAGVVIQKNLNVLFSIGSRSVIRTPPVSVE